MAVRAIKKGTPGVTQVETKPTRVPRQPKNDNLGSFVDAVTPESKQWISQMVDIALSITKQEHFLSMGEIIAINSLRKQGILV